MGGAFYENVLRVAKLTTLNQSKAIFGSDGRYVFQIRSGHWYLRADMAHSTNIGRV